MKIVGNKMLCRPVLMETPTSKGVILPKVRTDDFRELIVLEKGPTIKDFKIGDRILVHRVLPTPVIDEGETLYFVAPHHVDVILD